MTPDEYWTHTIAVPWYAATNDMVGGWSVVTKEVESLANSWGDPELIEIASFVQEDAAKHIAALHNAWLAELIRLVDPYVSDSDEPTDPDE